MYRQMEVKKAATCSAVMVAVCSFSVMYGKTSGKWCNNYTKLLHFLRN